jgi:tetratricopeptide (TPR) repeat protein
MILFTAHFDAAIQGFHITEGEAETLRAKGRAGSSWARARLLGYLAYNHPESEEAALEALWWVRNFPGSRIVRYTASSMLETGISPEHIISKWKIWTHHITVQPRDRNVLLNASAALEDLDPVQALTIISTLIERGNRSYELLMRGVSLARKLARESEHKGQEGWVRKTRGFLKDAISILQVRPMNPFDDLNAVEAALFVNDLDSAAMLAQRVLNGVHGGPAGEEHYVRAQTSIGLIAVARGELETASEVLKQLGTAGFEYDCCSRNLHPTELAQELLPTHRTTVIQFLENVPETSLPHSKNQLLEKLKQGEISVRISPYDYTANVMAHRARELQALGRRAEALELLTRARRRAHIPPVAKYSIGVMMDRLGEAAEAIDLVAEALSEDASLLPTVKASIKSGKQSDFYQLSVERLISE